MELVIPGRGLISWQVMFSVVPLFLMAWIMALVTNRLDATQKIAWLPGTLFLPLIGPLIFFIKFSSFKKPSTQA